MRHGDAVVDEVQVHLGDAGPVLIHVVVIPEEGDEEEVEVTTAKVAVEIVDDTVHRGLDLMVVDQGPKSLLQGVLVGVMVTTTTIITVTSRRGRDQ